MQMVGEMSENEKAKIAQDFFNDFSKFFSENQIFFDKKLATKTHKLKHDLLEVWNGFLYSRDLKAGEERKQSFQEWNKAFKRLNEEIPNILTEIENDFRSIIGIE